jgi:folate-binding protein YgfZ
MNMKDSIRLLSSGAISADCGNWSLLKISGGDAGSFLANITTNEVRNLSQGQGNWQALLTKKSQVIVDFFAYSCKGHFILICKREDQKLLTDSLENYLFSEDVTITRFELPGWQIHGAKSPEILQQTHGKLPPFPFAWNEKNELDVFSLPVLGEPGYLILGEALPELDGVANLASGQLKELLHTVGAEAGFPQKGVDFSDENLVLELDLGSRLVNTSKGCYPGQEVIAKVISRGKIPRKLVALMLPDDSKIGSEHAGETVFVDGVKAGLVQRVYFSERLRAQIALAFLKTKYTDSAVSLECRIGQQTLNAVIRTMPFYLSSYWQKQRDKYYADGMQAYHQNDYQQAETSFRSALEFDEHHADSWEALAMSAEKRGEIDEAIRLNKRYLSLEPTAVLAHSNLSRLYMLQGFKDKAEEEQGKAALLEMKKRASANKSSVSADEIEKKEAEQKEAEFQRRMKIFKQVLEMDAEDEIANFGLGKLLLEKGDAKSALIHLEKVIANNSDYSMAWQLLGQAQIKLGQLAKAREVLAEGIAVAEGQGDLMPAKAMKQMLSLL